MQSRVPRNRRFLWILPAKAALPPLETTANRVLSPLLDDPESKEFAIPLESQLVLKGMPTKEKWFVDIHFKTAEKASALSDKGRKLWLFCSALGG